MSSFPGSPRLLKGGIVLLDPTTAAVQRIITLQYNPDTLTRSLQIQAAETGTKDRSEALRLKGPPIETFKFDAEIDATDQLEFPGQNSSAVEFGINPQLVESEKQFLLLGLCGVHEAGQRERSSEAEALPPAPKRLLPLILHKRCRPGK